MVDRVIAVGLEEEVTGLPRQHRKPADEAGERRIRKEQAVADEKDQCADQMQRLIDPALMVVAIIVPALRAQHVGEAAHTNPQWLSGRGRVVPLRELCVTNACCHTNNTRTCQRIAIEACAG